MKNTYEVAVTVESPLPSYFAPQYYYISAEDLVKAEKIANSYAVIEWQVKDAEIISIKKLGRVIDDQIIEDIKVGKFHVKVKK